jgi:hypothetical protein
MKHVPVTPATDDPLPDYQPIVLRRQRHDGWTAERQQTFLVALAETGCISESCRVTGITARSAYRLRAHKDGKGFAEAWDQALRYATARLMTLCYERAIRGSVREVWRDGMLISESRQPSDMLLRYLLGQLAPWQKGKDTHWANLMAASGHAAADLAPAIDKLTDCDVPADALADADLLGQPPTATDPRIEPFDAELGEDDDYDA